MSRTSTITNIHRIYPRSVSKVQLQRSSTEGYKIGQGRRDETPEKWFNDKVHDELSSFIAEFSYLTDAPKHSVTQKSVLPSPTYRVYPVHRDEDDAGPFIHRAKASRSRSRGFRKGSKPRRKSVEWRDQTDSLVMYRRKLENSPGTPTCDMQSPASGEGMCRIVHEENPKRKRRFRARSKSSGIQGCVKISSSKSRTRMRRASRSRHKSRRSQSQCRVRKVTPIRKRRRKSRSSSCVNCMPYYAQRRRSKTRVRKVRRKEVRRKSSVKKMRVKKMVPLETPTIVTIYPSNKPHKKLKPDFLADGSLTCKCFDCLKKYESLKKLPPPLALPACRPKVAPCTRFVCEPKICYYDNPCAFPLPDCTLLDSCHRFGDGYRSVSMKFNCIGQYLDSTIVQYFHSILDQSIYC